jgi:hypothetical protein
MCYNLRSDAAGPKLRKWYGEGERLPADGEVDAFETSLGPDVVEQDVGPRDAILVTDGSSLTGEQVVLQLVLSR